MKMWVCPLDPLRMVGMREAGHPEGGTTRRRLSVHVVLVKGNDEEVVYDHHHDPWIHSRFRSHSLSHPRLYRDDAEANHLSCVDRI